MFDIQYPFGLSETTRKAFYPIFAACSTNKIAGETFHIDPVSPHVYNEPNFTMMIYRPSTMGAYMKHPDSPSHVWQCVQLLLLGCILATTSLAQTVSYEPIQLASDPALSPDGKTLAFTWRGDIWLVPTNGGIARQLTQHPASDRQPTFSPDGSEIAFTSNREAGWQVYVMPVGGGVPQQRTFHTEGYTLEEWFPSGDAFLASGSRDHFWRHAQRFFQVARRERVAEKLLFDAYGRNGTLSPDERYLLFTREGISWWRKGYRGSRASQIWLYDFETQEFRKLIHRDTGSRWPLWKPDKTGFYYVGAQSGSFNLWEHNLETGEERQWTYFQDDSVVFPCISRDGSTLVFRYLFDFYRFQPGKDETPKRIEIWNAGDSLTPPMERRKFDKATDFTVSEDGLEIAFIAGGDLWVMDTELREPQQITSTPEEEEDPAFSPDGDAIYFVSDQGGQSDIWRVERSDPELYWWLNETFEFKQLTQDVEVDTHIRFSPDGTQFAFVKGLGDLWVMKPDGKDARRILESNNHPDYDWSPDGKWIVYQVYDNDFNRDIWVLPTDGSAPPVNISRHPYNEFGPVWSPNGKLIAFIGERLDRDRDIFYVWLQEKDDEQTKRERTLEKALEKMNKARKRVEKESKKENKEEEEKDEEKCKTNEEKDSEEKKEEKNLPEVIIDFERIHERIRRIAIPDSTEGQLFWSHDSRKLAFTATIDGKRGIYTVEIPDELKPKLLTTTVGSYPIWLKEGNQIIWLSGGVPASVSSGGKETKYPFNVKQEVDRKARYAAAFDLAWRTMRDRYYDERLGNRNWDAIRRKYADMAAEAVDPESFGMLLNLMLGELNGSHLGFSPSQRSYRPPAQGWNIATAHLGVRFEPDYKGPGWKIKEILPRGPADKEKNAIRPGEVILSVDGVNVDPAMDPSQVLNGVLDRDISLRIQGAGDETREVNLRPISYGAARGLLYEKWLRDNRQKIDKASDGSLGYVHIRGMSWPSFRKFEQELYAVGAGKDGLIIDVRENGGGFTADHLLTILTQPTHAITVPRDGGPGYPQDRRVYATWNKPIAVLCNQNSFSNAEIFSHAIKTLKRGHLIGVPTAGGVISTGRKRIMDVGYLRVPFRGWFVLPTGEDMELNGAIPDFIVWNRPGQIPQGEDAQLDKAIEVLLNDVETWKTQPRPTLRKASERIGE